MKRERILLIDGSSREGAALQAALSERGFEVALASDAGEGLSGIPTLGPSAVLADAELPGCDGATLVARLREVRSDAAVVVLADADRIGAAVAALRAGAESFLLRPVEPAQAAVVLEKALEKRGLRRDGAALRQELRQRLAVVGSAPEVLAALEVARRAAPTKATVLVLGEPGTGRRHLAQAIHEASPRRDRPFVPVRCAALSDALLEAELFGNERGAFPEAEARRIGAVERADGGTLHLDDVSHLPPGVQVRLLRLLQQGEIERQGGSDAIRVDVRVIASSQVDLAEAVRAGRLRDDLYYRLGVVSLSLPPLRARKADIPALVQHFVERHGRAAGRVAAGASPGALSLLFAHGWPGNVRELENVVERACASSRLREIGVEDLPPVLSGAAADRGSASALIPGATLFEIEREAILRTLEEVGGSTARAAEVLGVSIRKIQYRLKEYRAGYAGRRRAAGEVAFPREVRATR
ncbi:MAG TPA: sigma-54 dependent transcriptional regulator [Anaeromyxobacteraceae bacterium]|nr:sigma-54 dependent transcriptional regulator [Anaeromyxobacteraceae bacterium]